MQEGICKEGKAEVHIFSEHAQRAGGKVFGAGKGQFAADKLDLLGDLSRCSSLGPLVQHLRDHRR